MSGEDLGTARLDLVCDVTAFEAAINRARSLTGGMANDTKQAFDSANNDVKKAQTSLFRYIELLGRSSNEAKLLQAAMRGVDSKVIEEARQRMLAHQQSVQADKEIVEELNVSWKKMQATANAAAAELKNTARVEMLEAQARAARDAAAAEELLKIKEQHAAQGQQFANDAAEAALIRRRADAIAAFTVQLDELEAAESRLGAQRSFLTSLESTALAAGKTRSELLAMKAAELGVEAEAAPFIAKLQAQEGALLGAANKFNAYGKSTKEVQLALRGVPAQLTDVFVSLQGGQAPLTVLLQQGGQLRDMFGGIRPAIGALGGALMNLVNPFTIVLGVAGAMVAAWYQGEKESSKLAQSIAMVGDYAGVTSGQLEGMAASMVTANRTQHAAAMALAEVVQSGKFTADTYGLIAAAATDMEHATGQALDKTIQQFASLRDDPKKAVAELNKENHFLTAEIFKQIVALQEQGRTQEAARVAQEAYARSVIDKAADVEKNLGTLQRAWRSVASTAKAAWDSMLDLGREETPEAKIAKLSEQIKRLQAVDASPLNKFDENKQLRKDRIKALTDELMGVIKDAARERNQAQDDAAVQEANDYLISQQGVVDAHKSADAKTAADIQRYTAEYNHRIADADRRGKKDLARQLRQQRDTLIAELQAEQDKRNAGKNSGIANASAKNDLQDFKDQLAEEQNAIQNSTQLLQAQYGARLVSTSDYYARLIALTQQGTAAQERAITGEIAVLRARSLTGKDAIENTRQIKQLESELARARADGATKVAILKTQESDLAKQRQFEVDNFKRGLDQENAALEMQFQLRAQAMGLGQREAELIAQIAQARADEANKLQELYDKQRQNPQDESNYQQEIDIVKRATDAKVAIILKGYEEMARAQADWLGGMRAGFMDWIAQAEDASGQLRSMTSHDMDTIADSLTDAAETGKFKWREMLIDMLKELEKFLIKQAILKAAYSFIGAFSSGAAGAGSSASGAGWTTNAKGGVYDSPSLSQYSNGVYDKPQVFAFARGGVFAEAGPEAIMPLTRGPDGNLGVRAQMGSGGGSDVTINVNTTVNNDGSGSTNTEVRGGNQNEAELSKRFAERMRIVANDEIKNQMRQGGLLWKMGVGE